MPLFTNEILKSAVPDINKHHVIWVHKRNEKSGMDFLLMMSNN